MRVIVGCEESAKVRDAFRKLGHDAWSCDLVPTRGDPEWHLQGDVIAAIYYQGPWDIIILHPPCTALCVSGNGTYAKTKPLGHLRIEAGFWTNSLWKTARENARIGCALENPVGVLGSYIGKRTQTIHPWQFGHGETKTTHLWLDRLPPLVPTNIVSGRENRIWKMGPSDTRARERSETYQGIADAMAAQWGSL